MSGEIGLSGALTLKLAGLADTEEVPDVQPMVAKDLQERRLEEDNGGWSQGC